LAEVALAEIALTEVATEVGAVAALVVAQVSAEAWSGLGRWLATCAWEPWERCWLGGCPCADLGAIDTTEGWSIGAWERRGSCGWDVAATEATGT